MKKILVLLSLVLSPAVFAMDGTLVLNVFDLQTVTSTNSGTNYSFGSVYTGTNGVSTNAVAPYTGNVLFIARGLSGASNVLVRLQDSSNGASYTTRAQWNLTNNNVATYITNLGSLNQQWRIQVANTNGNAGSTAGVSVTAVGYPKYQ